MTIDLEGRVYIAFADGCIDACASSADPQPADSRTGRGSVYFLNEGPSLYLNNEQLSGFESSSLSVDDKPVTLLAEQSRPSERKVELE